MNLAFKGKKRKFRERKAHSSDSAITCFICRLTFAIPPFVELRRWNEASSELSRRSWNAWHEHVSRRHSITHLNCLCCAYTHLNISSCVFRGPGGRGPWPNPNANSVSVTSKNVNIAITLRNGFITISSSHR